MYVCMCVYMLFVGLMRSCSMLSGGKPDPNPNPKCLFYVSMHLQYIGIYIRCVNVVNK